MRTKIYLITLASSFGLIILGAVTGGILESMGTVTGDTIGPRGTTALLVAYFTLVCVAVFALVPLALKFFIIMQIKIGNADFFLVRWLQAHEQAVVYCFWGVYIIGLCISLPAAIKSGFFE